MFLYYKWCYTSMVSFRASEFKDHAGYVTRANSEYHTLTDGRLDNPKQKIRTLRGHAAEWYALESLGHTDDLRNYRDTIDQYKCMVDWKVTNNPNLNNLWSVVNKLEYRLTWKNRDGTYKMEKPWDKIIFMYNNNKDDYFELIETAFKHDGNRKYIAVPSVQLL